MHETAEPQIVSDNRTADPWAALEAELDAWAAAGLTATFWWRDDDAGEMTASLDRLLRLRQSLDVSLALAVVPTRADGEFRDRMASEPAVAVLQHGYSHHNFATPDERKIELDGSRPADYVIADLAVGMQTLSALPGWAPVLVPPWNRIAPHLMPMLPELGYRGLSMLGPRARQDALRGLRQNNVHVDPIDWRGRHTSPGAFAGTGRVIAAAIDHLAARRSGEVDRDEATGLMTHHLVQDEATWAFIEEFIARTKTHVAAAWLSASEVFGLV